MARADLPTREKVASVEHVETGGLRWGKTFWRSANATRPFASIVVKPGQVHIALTLPLPIKLPRLADQEFEFVPSDIVGVRKQRGLLSTGLRFEHSRPDYPPFVLFWTRKPHELMGILRQAGFSTDG